MQLKIAKNTKINSIYLVYSEFVHFRLGHYTIFTSVSSHGLNLKITGRLPRYRGVRLVPFVMSSNESSNTLFHNSQSSSQTGKNFWGTFFRGQEMSIKVSLKSSCYFLPKHFHIFFCYSIRFKGAYRYSVSFSFSWIHSEFTLNSSRLHLSYPPVNSNLTLISAKFNLISPSLTSWLFSAQIKYTLVYSLFNFTLILTLVQFTSFTLS